MRSEFYSLQKYIIFFKTKTTELQNENIKLNQALAGVAQWIEHGL